MPQPRDQRTKHPLYFRHFAMKNRCYNKKNPKYETWGGRGITVCERWLGVDGFWNFVEDMGIPPTKHHSLDRIDNDKGYSPLNCRWATPKEQSNNRRPHKNPTGITGVSLLRGSYVVHTACFGKSKHVGSYKSLKEASYISFIVRQIKSQKYLTNCLDQKD